MGGGGKKKKGKKDIVPPKFENLLLGVFTKSSVTTIFGIK